LKRLNEDKIKEIEESIDSSLQTNIDKQKVELWPSDAITGRVERLQSNPAVVSSDRKKRRNDTLFLGTYSSNENPPTCKAMICVEIDR
jgi:hypothetical protein